MDKFETKRTLDKLTVLLRSYSDQPVNTEILSARQDKRLLELHLQAIKWTETVDEYYFIV